MIVKTEAELIDFGREIGQNLSAPKIIELVGDVGAGKTTFTRGLAEGLGVEEPVTSPSFTIKKTYTTKNGGYLAHYDFYRLKDPGLMSEDLAESINDENTITVIEWGKSVENLLPPSHLIFTITFNSDGTRTIEEGTE
ncbi:tRNA (adenosine(37)-N6)-threonylcarbamoyltransferase complex ATPase subunit type 1 TsaE [Candidatus Saccharibacteria bacterium]|nr:tRNA (adenosine(37)-N6)-threonylcarbamoyltransferase complex ATPase subunit type 1 TsaE [Candidatus Saccharibacteria bacterium]MBR2989510.1 tRNA (adenosine(37)-N6)-threonylcarbamoyltransferase complex ATPase subunit type 1 TsaE [Candidatus Saccharibacteria bacterium]